MLLVFATAMERNLYSCFLSSVWYMLSLVVLHLFSLLKISETHRKPEYTMYETHDDQTQVS